MASVFTEVTKGNSPKRPPIYDIFKGEKLSASVFFFLFLGDAKKEKGLIEVISNLSWYLNYFKCVCPASFEAIFCGNKIYPHIQPKHYSASFITHLNDFIKNEVEP